ncbi:GNAT family N-acetyltransferase [Shewanella sp.]|uniref:GNAT family N-acetyltransferase n=1 Tax=Shewanella sp. TaxID=50422 RepID=UPI001EBF55CF|nr:GNAT family N-acetyltransferase [Shewanella sp.]NRB25965.1 GNAT family N-acetyltransferase [Shewanella sp.]
MQITSSRIKLQPLDQSDWELFKELNQCPKIMEHLYDRLPLDQIKTVFESRTRPITEKSDGWCFSISDASTGEKLGNIGLKLTDIKERIAEVGFMLKEEAQGKGYASEALNLVAEYVFHTLKLNKIAAICSTENSGSYKLLEKVGFSRESFLPQNTSINGKLVDDYVYGLSKPVI